MESILTFLKEQISTNQLFTGGAILMTMGAILHQCRAVPARIWRWIKCRFVIEVDIPDRDQAFVWLDKWLALHPYGQKRARLLTVRTERPDTQRPDDRPTVHGQQPKIILSPAPGYHYFFYRGRFVILERERKDGGKQEGAASFLSIRESFLVKVFTRDRSVIQSLLEDARELVHPKGEKRISIMTARYGGWAGTVKRRPRPIESVILQKGMMEELIADMKLFRSREEWYIERGIPYRRGYLLSGPPGSGKSSAVVALASHFDMDIAIMNLNSSDRTDDELRDSMADVPTNTLVLIEDIDCVFTERKAEKKRNKLTFSGLLNAIDGVAAGEGRILFLTTNHPEKLDPALVRPGRADIRKEIGPPDAGQICRLFERFFPSASPSQTLQFVEAIDTPDQTSMAALQGHLLKYSDDANQAIKHAPEVYHVG